MFAEWKSSPGHVGCDAVALAAVTTILSVDSYWIRLEGSEAHYDDSASDSATFADIGWCLPSIDIKGNIWMGWQKGEAWVYRGEYGNFKVADGIKDQGTKYGQPFSVGSNVTAVRHSSTSLEFFLDGYSQGKVELPAAQALPTNAVPCASACASIKMGLMAGAAPPGPKPTPPPPTPPLPPTPSPVNVVLAKCASNNLAQQWRYDATKAQFLHVSGGGLATSTSPGPDAGDFAAVELKPGGGSLLWWSPDETMGYIHSGSSYPMNCNCLAVCGGA